jgi:hypothetical protein
MTTGSGGAGGVGGAAGAAESAEVVGSGAEDFTGVAAGEVAGGGASAGAGSAVVTGFVLGDAGSFFEPGTATLDPELSPADEPAIEFTRGSGDTAFATAEASSGETGFFAIAGIAVGFAGADVNAAVEPKAAAELELAFGSGSFFGAEILMSATLSFCTRAKP